MGNWVKNFADMARIAGGKKRNQTPGLVLRKNTDTLSQRREPARKVEKVDGRSMSGHKRGGNPLVSGGAPNHVMKRPSAFDEQEPPSRTEVIHACRRSFGERLREKKKNKETGSIKLTHRPRMPNKGAKRALDLKKRNLQDKGGLADASEKGLVLSCCESLSPPGRAESEPNRVTGRGAEERDTRRVN